MLTANHGGDRARATKGQRASCPTCGGEVVATPLRFLRDVYRWAHVNPCPGPGDGWRDRVALSSGLRRPGGEGPLVLCLHGPGDQVAVVIDGRQADATTGLSLPGADPPSFLLTPAWGWLPPVIDEALDLAPGRVFVALHDRTLFWARARRPEVTTRFPALGGVVVAPYDGRRVGLANILTPAAAPVHPRDQYRHQRGGQP